LGAVNGILFGASLELISRSIFLYEGYVQAQTPTPPDLHIQMAPYPFNWWYLPTLFLALVALASFIAHRYLAGRVKSALWLWQAIGIMAVAECGLYAVIMIVWYQWRGGFGFLGMGYLAQAIKSDLKLCLVLLPLAVVFNLLFSKALRSWKVALP
jgi:hypothetical protein